MCRCMHAYPCCERQPYNWTSQRESEFVLYYRRCWRERKILKANKVQSLALCTNGRKLSVDPLSRLMYAIMESFVLITWFNFVFVLIPGNLRRFSFEWTRTRRVCLKHRIRYEWRERSGSRTKIRTTTSNRRLARFDIFYIKHISRAKSKGSFGWRIKI